MILGKNKLSLTLIDNMGEMNSYQFNKHKSLVIYYMSIKLHYIQEERQYFFKKFNHFSNNSEMALKDYFLWMHHPYLLIINIFYQIKFELCFKSFKLLYFCYLILEGILFTF